MILLAEAVRCTGSYMRNLVLNKTDVNDADGLAHLADA
jgi:hypothetical protein